MAPFEPEHLPALVALFVAGLRRLRRRVPALPPTLTQRAVAAELVGRFLVPGRCVVALDGRAPVGYLGWGEYDSFRGVAQRAAYSPEYGHAASAGRSVEVHRALYRVAAARWFAAGCRIHCLTCLGGDYALERFWFESGFGMLGQDALRPLPGEPTHGPRSSAAAGHGLRARPAVPADIPVLVRLDAEHTRHYADAPVLMVPPRAETAAALRRFLATPPNGYWLIEGEGEPQGFLRFEPVSRGAAHISLAPDTISITGAYVRPAWRGRGAATALLGAAIADFAARGFARMAVDYETINPEALAFWPRYFRVVASSYVRIPERT